MKFRSLFLFIIMIISLCSFVSAFNVEVDLGDLDNAPAEFVCTNSSGEAYNRYIQQADHLDALWDRAPSSGNDWCGLNISAYISDPSDIWTIVVDADLTYAASSIAFGMSENGQGCGDTHHNSIAYDIYQTNGNVMTKTKGVSSTFTDQGTEASHSIAGRSTYKITNLGNDTYNFSINDSDTTVSWLQYEDINTVMQVAGLIVVDSGSGNQESAWNDFYSIQFYDTLTAPPVSGTITTTLIAPTNNTYSNNYFQDFTFNYTYNETADVCQLWTNETGTFALEESLVDGVICNQPNATKSDGCGLSTGVYNFSNNGNDGDDTSWLTTVGDWRINYTIPSLTHTVKWELLTYDSDGADYDRINYTLPNNCLDNNVAELRYFKDTFDTFSTNWSYQCMNDTGWYTVFSHSCEICGHTYHLTEESLWLDSELNVNTTLTIPHNFTDDGEYIWNIGCNASGVNMSFASDNYTIVLDSVNPTMSGTNFTNGTVIYLTNNTYQFNFTDDNLYSFLATLNGNVLNNDTGITGTTYQGNVTINHTELGLINYLFLQVADGHTASKLFQDYDISDGLFNDKLIYDINNQNRIEINAKDGSIFDTFSTKKEFDRYAFDYSASDDKALSYTFIVDSDKYIDIVTKEDTKWNTWLITGNNWIDFYQDDYPNDVPVYKRISSTQVEVTVLNKNNGEFKFNSIGDLNIVNYNYTIYGLQVSTSHSNVVTEGQANTPYLFVNVSNTSLVTVNAELIYNGTTYTPTKTNTSVNYTFSQTVNAPLLSAANSSNITFYWNLTTPSGSSLITLYQNVVNMLVDNCSDFSIRAVNFSMYDDGNDSLSPAELDGYFEIWINDDEKQDFNVSWGYGTKHSLCLYDNGSYNTYAQMEYTGQGGDYRTKTYYFYNATLNGTTQFVNLWSTANTTQVKFEVTDENDDAVTDAYVHVLKYSLPTNSYTTSSMLKTDNDGIDYGEIALFDTWYKFFVYKDGVLLLATEPTKIITTTKKLRVDLLSSYSTSYDELNNMATSLTFNNVTNNFVYTFTNPTGLAKTFCLKVTKRKVTKDTLINESCTTATSGTILVNIGGSPENAYYFAHGTVSGSPTLLDRFLEWKVSDKGWEEYGQDGIFMTVFLKITLAMIGIWNPIVAIIMLILADVSMMVMGIFEWSWSVLMMYIIMGALVIWKVNRR